jgi:hypothetical protein
MFKFKRCIPWSCLHRKIKGPIGSVSELDPSAPLRMTEHFYQGSFRGGLTCLPRILDRFLSITVVVERERESRFCQENRNSFRRELLVEANGDLAALA